ASNESCIAKNQQKALQTQSIAEACAKVVVECVQDPSWAVTNAALPVNATLPAAVKTNRRVGMNPASYDYQGVYRPDVTRNLLDKPYRSSNNDRFFGNEDNADLVINRTTAPALIDTFNDKLLACDTA